MYNQYKNIYQNNIFLLCLIWSISLAFNINKAFHIDDVFHIQAAQWIAQHPITPMSGEINWKEVPEKMAVFNQPPLYFYALAAVGSLFGFTEVPLHLFQSLFVFGALWYFYRIAQLLRPENARLLLLLFGFCPAFMVNQNLMTDVVILMFSLGAAYFLLKPAETDRQTLQNFLLAAAYIGLSLLVKYSQLPFLVVIFLYLIYINKRNYLWVLLLPLTLLAGWSAMNWWEFGHIHIANRPSNPMVLKKILDQTLAFVACLGAITPFGVLLIGERLPNTWRNRLLLAWVIIWSALAIGAYSRLLLKVPMDVSITVLSLLNAGTLLVLCALQIRGALHRRIEPSMFLLLMWLGGVMAFMSLFAPFMATRHVLLVVPPVLLLLMPRTRIAEGIHKSFAIGSTLLLGVLLTYSDWLYADFYRSMARTLPLPENATVWGMGHWGWQGYSEARGMRPYTGISTDLRPGDYVVYPLNINRQQISDDLHFINIKKYTKKPTLGTFVYCSDFAALYTSSLTKASWTLARKPVDTIIVRKVVAE